MSAISGDVSANKLQLDYMKLLTTQLKNQNPLEPMNNTEMSSQLAMFSQLSQLESMNSKLESLDNSFSSSFSDALNAANRVYANSLLDKQVTFFVQDEETGDMVKKSGKVKEVFSDPESGDVRLGVNSNGEEYSLGLGSVVLVENSQI